MKKALFILSGVMLATGASAQIRQYTMAQAHSHNDYERATPFYAAASLQFGSIEADIHLKNGVIYVAHDSSAITPFRTFREMYLQPVLRQFALYNGKAYADGAPMQLLIDLKTAGTPTLQALQELLLPYRQYFDRSVNPNAVKLVLSGNLPPMANWPKYDPIFFFDGRPDSVYPAALKPRVAMLSVDFHEYSGWNGKGTLIPTELEKVTQVINKAHEQGYAFRFWGAPSTRSTYYKLMDLGADWIGTDHPEELYDVMHNTTRTTAANMPVHPVYQPTFASDATQVRSKNVILMIGDGTGLAEMFSGYTANKGALNIFQMKQLGLSKTASTDNYHTDSAAGGSAMGTGTKTHNRAIGLDNTYVSIPVIPEILAPKGIQSGVIVTEEITGATPASFYGHTADRDSTYTLEKQLLNSKLQLAVGGGREELDRDFGQQLAASGIQVYDNLDNWNATTKNRTLVILSDKVVTSMRGGRGNYLKTALKKALQQLNASGKGFFLMVEGSRIDHGGHMNDLDYLVREMLDFDEAVGEALRFADQDKQTTVIVTADHETGGLALMDGDIAKGTLRGHFATNDHTGIPVMVFAYGPNSQLFRGVYENNEIFHKMMKCFGK
ncbi:alkaline phosphatase [Chitinophaga arvensicola]|uniref:Alkaline phosphatase n=1 Tax=Chitinophaga arvensicola TaxID=29529 RepID=A0A1I0RJP8_9BACT|nr:alkaline phosphatase [Chitinophaga arvensicola]SEW41142.1 alkaline phosphatase [Chitinophaga arvensicola]